jgi:hypothetical protein
MKVTHQLMLLGLSMCAGAAALVVANTPYSPPKLTAPPQPEATAIPVDREAQRSTDPIEDSALINQVRVAVTVHASTPMPENPLLAFGDIGNLELSVRADNTVVVPVVPCWRQDALPALPSDYRDLMKPGALVCGPEACLAGYTPAGQTPVQPASDQPQRVVDPAQARLVYQRDPNCIVPTAAP